MVSTAALVVSTTLFSEIPLRRCRTCSRPSNCRSKEPRLSWPSFRHTHAPLLTEVGESIKTAQAQLGHSDLATTLNLYAHVIPDSQRRAVERVAGVLFSSVRKLDDGAKNGRINGLKNQQMQDVGGPARI